MKKIFIFMLFCCTISKTTAQNSTIQATEEAPNWPLMLSQINTSLITSGILLDKITPFTNVINYNTHENNLSNSKHFSQALSELYRASDNNRFISKTELDNRTVLTTATNSVDVGIINTSFQMLNYNEEIPTNGGLLFQNGIFYSFLNRPLYISKKVTLVSPLKDMVSGSSIIFNFKNNLVFNNATTNLKTMVVDFGDGTTPTAIINNGAITIPTKNVTYNATGMKTLKYTITFSDNSVLTTFGMVYVNVVSNTQRLSGFDFCDELLRDRGIFTSTIPYQGYTDNSPVFGRLEYTIFYGSANSAKKMIKPIILVDGFDPKDKRKVKDCDCQQDPTCNYNNTETTVTWNGLFPTVTSAFNPLKYESIYDSMNYIGFNVITGLPSDKNLTEELRSKGYDVIVINFPTYISTNILGQLVGVDGGADYIERNAMSLASYMQFIKTQQNTAGSSEKLVLIGPSMGGQITRYALAHMEKQFAATGLPVWQHNARLWVSVDSPHLGANIPIGAQANIWFLGEKLGKQAAEIKFNQELNSVAGKQQIIYQFQNALQTGILNNNPFFTTYYNNLKNNGVAGSGGYPVSNSSFRKIALVNGSLTGKKDALEQQTFFKARVYVRRLWPYQSQTVTLLRLQDMFMPETGQNSTVFRGDGQNFKLGFNNSAINHQRYSLDVANFNVTGSLDVVPGGYFKTAKYIKEAVVDGAAEAGYRNDVPEYIENHSFISTFSALGHLNPNQNWSNPLNTNLTCPSNKQTPFDSYYGTSENTQHTSFTKESAAWLFKELDGDKQAPYFPIEENLIRGNPVLCNEKIETYTIYDICKTPSPVKYNNQAGIPVKGWSVEGNIVIISSTPYTVTVKGTSDVLSDGKIIATYQNGLQSIKLVKIGIPVVANQTINGGSAYVSMSSTDGFSLSTPVAGATNYRWFITYLSTDPNCGCTTNSDGFVICPPNVIRPKFLESGSTTYNTPSTGVYVNWGNCPGMYLITCIAENDCGSTQVNIKNIVVVNPSGGGGGSGNPCPGYRLQVYPNPVKTGIIEINIAIPNDPCFPAEGYRTINSKQNDVKIYDMFGLMVYSNKYKDDNFTISNLNLKKGNYILHVDSEKGGKLKEIIIIE